MKIEVEVPDDCIDKPIRIFSDFTMVAFRYPFGHPWMVKTQKCKMCGECCRHCREDDPRFPAPNGVCMWLKDSKCALKIDRPFACGAADTVWTDLGCTVRWERR